MLYADLLPFRRDSHVRLTGCSTDVYRAHNEALQFHTQKFQTFLHREQIEAAMHENHAIELIGLQLKGGCETRRRGTAIAPLGGLREQSAVNWGWRSPNTL